MSDDAQRLWNEVTQLVEAQLYDGGSVEQASRLEQLLRADPHARRMYFEYIDDCVRLSDCLDARAAQAADETAADATAADETAADAPRAAPPVPLPPREGDKGVDPPKATLFSIFVPSERWLDVMPVVIFAGVMLVAGIFFGTRMFGPADQPRLAERPRREAVGPAADQRPKAILPVQVATLVEAAECVWVESPVDFNPGSLVFEGQRLQLASGAALLVLRSGTRLAIEGPTTLSMPQPGRLSLARGSIAARVPPEALGFSVDTPIATVVDLGTEFSVTVEPDNAVEVHVFVGNVAISGRAPNSSLRSERLSAAEARRLPSGDPTTWSHIEPVPELRFETVRSRALDRTTHGARAPAAPAVESKQSAVDWRPIMQESFGASGINEDRWRQLLLPLPGGVADETIEPPALRPSAQGLEVVNGAAIVSAAPIEMDEDGLYRVRAEVIVRHSVQNIYLLLRAKPAGEQGPILKHRVPIRFVQGIACMFGPPVPENDRNLVILVMHPGRDEPSTFAVPAPAPEAGRRYVLQATDDGRTVRFSVELTGAGGWTKELAVEIPPQLKSEGTAQVGFGNVGALPGEPGVSVLEKFSVDFGSKTNHSAPPGAQDDGP